MSNLLEWLDSLGNEFTGLFGRIKRRIFIHKVSYGIGKVAGNLSSLLDDVKDLFS